MRAPIRLAGRAEPPFLRYIEDDPVRILELPLEFLFFLVVAEVKEELASGFLDAALRLRNVIDLKAEMVGAHVVFRVLQARPAASEVVKQSEVDDTVG